MITERLCLQRFLRSDAGNTLAHRLVVAVVCLECLTSAVHIASSVVLCTIVQHPILAQGSCVVQPTTASDEGPGPKYAQPCICQDEKAVRKETRIPSWRLPMSSSVVVPAEHFGKKEAG